MSLIQSEEVIAAMTFTIRIAADKKILMVSVLLFKTEALELIGELEEARKVLLDTFE